MTNWVLLNVPIGVLAVLAIAGVPLWLVIKHPDTGPQPSAASQLVPVRPPAGQAAALPAYVQPAVS